MFKLVICDDEGKTTIVPLIRDEITIGRKEGNTIRLTDRNVSRSHARLVRQGDEVFSVQDLSSRNGTKINGDPIGGGGDATISPGDQIYIGDYNLSIRTDVSDGVPMGKQMDPGDGAGIGKVTSHARLVMLEGPEVGKEYDLTVNLYVIGRAEESNLHINDPSISRAHARMDGDEHQWTISDLDSINGIFVNGHKRDDYLLKSGDVIELGTVRLRFVPPGEPYDYAPPSEGSVAQAPSSGPNKLFIILGLVAALAVGAIVVVILATGSTEDPQQIDQGDQTNPKEDPKAMIEAGKDQMQQEAWDEAARLFAEAITLDPDNEAARTLKRTALSEMEAQSAMVAALSAQESKSWKKALEELQKISRSSYYYDQELLEKISALRCEELLVKARFIAKSGTVEDLEAVIQEFSEIPNAPAECLEERTKIRKARTEKTGGFDAAEKPAAVGGQQAIDKNPYGTPKASAPSTGPKPGKKPKAVNPYDSPGQIIDEEAPPAPAGPKKITW